MVVKVISFDLDGTLQDKKRFDDVVWYTSFPQAYAAQHKISFKEALRIVSSAYDKKGDSSPDWYKPSYWQKHFALKKNHKEMFDSLKHRIYVYKDAVPVLKRLKKFGEYKMIVLTHSPHEWVDYKMKVKKLGSYFDEVISTTDDMDAVKKNGAVFGRLCKRFRIKPAELLHIGDSYEHDYLAAKKAGCQALFLDRSGKRKGKDVIRSLSQVMRHI